MASRLWMLTDGVLLYTTAARSGDENSVCGFRWKQKNLFALTA